jgi:sodium transport system ATP-binding protein
MIRVENLSKTFIANSSSKKITFKKEKKMIAALDNVSMEFRDGEITGLLGLNGAGKSTLMRLIYGLLKPTSGDIFVENIKVAESPEAARRLLGVLPDDTGLYKRLTAIENIRYFGELHRVESVQLETSINELIKRLGMEKIADRQAEGFSLGERMKTALSRAIVHNPQHVLLDEPTNGLDVITTRAVRKLLHDLKEQGKCVVFSSHLMHEVKGLCDRIIVIARGKVVAQGQLNEILDAGHSDNLEDAFINLVSAEEDNAKENIEENKTELKKEPA